MSLRHLPAKDCRALIARVVFRRSLYLFKLAIRIAFVDRLWAVAVSHREPQLEDWVADKPRIQSYRSLLGL